eukprot:COSAG06_NODE_23918_length_678_cov_0.796200_2_plen_23_part_01
MRGVVGLQRLVPGVRVRCGTSLT